eukprot:TRINITY_DN68712_c0_g1_i1.p1 TRINITY_DN68712_c0_g1~~TRINITY_DN68712_c0_g1_i1.p1  ORF type:complete len:486 (+),score=69.17 TRINITY_DN68712_c0_g1_i1:436-1893(+)
MVYGVAAPQFNSDQNKPELENGKPKFNKMFAENAFFSVGHKNGFLPVELPLAVLPEKYSAVEELLSEMPVEKKDGSPGLLASGAFRSTIVSRLPDLASAVAEETDSRLLHALYRDYCILASAYCLEPCDLRFRETQKTGNGEYGKAEPVLPAVIAKPLVIVADKIGSIPWLDYTLGYGPGNFKLKDNTKGITLDNLDPIRLMRGGKDERGFIIVHIAMEAHTGKMVECGDRVFQAMEAGSHENCQTALRDLCEVATAINTVRENMWNESHKEAYLGLRTWIFGMKGSGLFPDDMLEYEGVEPSKRSYRGETGAQSTIIPYLDTVLGINQHYPTNDLTKYLMELRDYRPRNHREYLKSTEKRASASKVTEFYSANPETAACWLRCVDQVRIFRQGHWNFTKQYIIQNTRYPVATGGTPITTWLPNQLGATMQVMQDIIGTVKGFDSFASHLQPETLSFFNKIDQSLSEFLNYLRGEVEKLRKEYNQ